MADGNRPARKRGLTVQGKPCSQRIPSNSTETEHAAEAEDWDGDDLCDDCHVGLYATERR